MRKLENLLRQVSTLRVFGFFVLWNVFAFVYLPARLPQPGLPEFGAIDDPPAVTQLAYSSSSYHAVDDPPIGSRDAVRIAWVSASPVLYGDLANLRSADEPPGFLQAPVARELAARLGRPVAIEAYALPNSRILEKSLVIYHALQTRPDAIVLSFDYWDFSNHWISSSRFSNFRAGLMARHPLMLFQNPSLWPFLHASDIGWAVANVALPALSYREEIKAGLERLYSKINPLVYPPSRPEVSSAQQEGIAFFTAISAELGDTRRGRVGNQAILDGLLDEIRRSGIPAFVYVDPTQSVGYVETIALEAALARYRSALPAGTSLVIEPRSLVRFLDGIVLRNANHLRAPAPTMTRYLSDQLEALYRHAHS